MTHFLRLCLAPTALALVLACPQAQPGSTPTPTAVGPGAGDPRVVADTGDLYPARSPSQPEGPTPAADPATKVPSPGTGRPDDTNGVCRLYAPELPDPPCCQHTLGFDVRAAGAACGLPVYLGESFHNSCGFYYVREAGTSAQWFRITTIRGDTPKQAADEHVMLMHRTEPGVTAEPLPGVDGAWWVKNDEYRWAFLPGWKTVRLLAWKNTSCGDEAIVPFIRQVIAAPEVVDGPRRNGLIPTFAPEPPAAPAG